MLQLRDQTVGRWPTVARSALTGVVVVFAVLTGGPAAAAGPNASLSTKSAFTYDECATHMVAVAEVDAGPGGETASHEDVDAFRTHRRSSAAGVQWYLYDSSAYRYATNTATGGARVAQLGDDVARQVDEAIERAATGATRFPGHDGKPFLNVDEALPAADAGYYTEWTAAASGAKRGTDRVIIGGNPAAPDVIFNWDHAGTYIQVYP